MNPAPANSYVRDLLSLVDVLTPNEGEAKLLLGLDPNEAAEPKELAEELLQMGPEVVIVTLGSRGAITARRSGHSFETPAVPVRAVDTTGAGDCFNGSLVAELARGRPLEEAVRKSVAAASWSVRFRGVIDGLPMRGQLEAFMAEKSRELE